MKGSITANIIAYEDNDLSNMAVLELFSELIKSGLILQLQGHYGRVANDMISNGLIDINGKIADNAEEILVGQD
ncbi:MAG: hypothetical protein CL489_18020 [Acidobacteria bacterium]|nr:hypothetical protein [Acidobacteriota bacterium]|tara:strand:+ start:1581 stop:1802 length:222 start_codon:yes stop_codon:yes gene_type:complete